MSCYRPELPDEIIIIETAGKNAQLIYDLVTKAIKELKDKGMDTVIHMSNAIGKIPIRAKEQEERWVNPYDWWVYGFIIKGK